MKFQLSTVLAMMVASATAFNVASPPNNMGPAVRSEETTTQLPMSQQDSTNNAPMSLLAASLITLTSATTAAGVIMPPPAAAAPSKEAIQKMSAPEKEYYTLQNKMDLEAQSIVSFTKGAKEAKAEVTKLAKGLPDANKLLADAEATLATAEDSYLTAKAAKGQFTKTELKALKDRVATAKAALKAVQDKRADLSNSLIAAERAIEIDEDAIEKAKETQKGLKKKLEVSKTKLNKYLDQKKKEEKALAKKAAEIRAKKEKLIKQEEKKLKELVAGKNKAEKELSQMTKKVDQEQKKIDGMRASL